MMRNPEFVRNLWLVHSPGWLAVLPFLLGGIFVVLVGWNLGGEPEFTADRPRWEVYAFGLFIFVTVLFGAINALSTIPTEVREHTWDGQRMSAIPPWSMVWGKLCGSTALAWYGGLICILLYAYTARSQSLPAADVFRNIVVWILAALTAHSVAMLYALISLLKAPMTERQRGFSIVALQFIYLGSCALPVIWIYLPVGQSASWFGWQIDVLDFLALTAGAYAAWAVAALYFAMRREFQYTNSPLPWLGFAAFAILYAAGFEPGAGDPLTLLSRGRLAIDGLLPVYIGAFLLYAIALLEHTDWQSVRRIGRSFERREWKAIFDLTPRAILTLALLAGVVCVFVVGGDDSQWPVIGGREVTDDALIAALLFAARDMAVILLLGIAFSSNYSEVVALGYLVVVHGILPVAVYLLANPLLPLFWPVPTGSVALTIGPVLLQVVAACILLGLRVRGIYREVL